jgi:hypothetical protein
LHYAVTVGLFALAAGLIAPTSSRSEEMIARQQSWLDTAAAADDPYYYFSNPFRLSSQPQLKQSVFGFAGRTNSGNLGSTFAYGVGAPGTKFYDNYIAGEAYQRDFAQFNSGLLIGAEVGIADRFGNYRICCGTIVYSNRLVHAAELWGGVSLRHEGFALFDTVRISPGVCVWIERHIKSNRPGRLASDRPQGRRHGIILPGL